MGKLLWQTMLATLGGGLIALSWLVGITPGITAITWGAIGMAALFFIGIWGYLNHA